MSYSFPRLWELFNYSHSELEKDVSLRPGSYQGLTHEALYTSDEDLLEIFHHPAINGTFLDLGCGSGRATILYGLLFPERKSIGIEFEASRIKAGLSFKDTYNLSNIELLTADLMSSEIPEADTYFLYFPTGPVLDKILHSLFQLNKSFKVVAIESHGDLFPRLELENWLDLKLEIPLMSKRHHPMAKVFERNFFERSSHPAFDLSFKEKFLFIAEEDYQWIAETYLLEWTFDNRFELMTPPRTIYWNQVTKVLGLDQIAPLYHPALLIRRLGEVKIVTNSKEHTAFIRKIIFIPTFELELSSGEKVEWGDILTISQGSTLCYALP